MVAFDTVSETFRLMSLPPVTGCDIDGINLFDMHGTLAVSAVSEWLYVDIWALKDYDGERWTHRLCVKLTPSGCFRGPMCGQAMAGLEGDMLVVVAFGWVVLYDMKEKRTVSKIDHGDIFAHVWRCIHRESLVPAVLKEQ